MSGGKYPRWRGNGSDIVCLAPDGKLMSSAIRFTSESVEAGAPEALFRDLSPDGQRFLVLNAARGRAPGSLSLLLNWTGLLHQ